MTDPILPSPELAAVARRWLTDYAARRIEPSEGLLSGSAALSFVGSDEGERMEGEEMRGIFAAFTRGHTPLEVQRIESQGWERGELGWAVAFLELLEPASGIRASVRSTLVFSLEAGVWRVAHVHNSNPKPNIEAHGYATRGLDELVAAVRSERVEIGRTGIASIMFTDIVDSTALAEAMGDRAWSRIVEAHVAGVAARVAAAEGELVKSLGDGTLSSFPTASGALRAAAAIQSDAAAAETEPRLRVRIGVHTGDLVRTQDDYLGGVVNKAARIAAAAAPEETRVSEATRLMAGGAPGLRFEDPIQVALKGLEGEHLLHRLAADEG